MTEQSEQMVEMATEIKLLRSMVGMHKEITNLVIDSNFSLKETVKQLQDRRPFSVSNDIIGRYKQSLSDAYDRVRELEEEVYQLKKQNAELKDASGKVDFKDIEMHKKFKIESSQDIYEKLDERLYGNGTNAYNLTAQHYCYINPTTNVIPFTHTY